MKRIVTMLLAFTLVFSLFGCGGGTKSYVIPLDVDMSNKPTLNIHLQAVGSQDINSGRAYDVIERNTGYKVNYSQFSTDNNTAELNSALTLGAKYNAIKIQKADYDKLLAQDALLDIKPALERYGQDLLASTFDYSWQMVTKDGGIYGIPEGGPPTKGQMNVADCILFRKDILRDNPDLGNVPTTKEEFQSLLTKVKAKPSLGMEYPFTFSNMHNLIPALAVSFDIYQQWEKVGDEYKFYFEREEYKDYMNYMIELRNSNLIDLNSPTQDNSAAKKHFADGKSIAIACSAYDIDGIMDSLVANGKIASDVSASDVLAEVGGLKDSKGEVHTYHTGGYSYVTVIPKYMNEQAAYTIDHLNKKIQLDNYKDMYIGEENVHYTVNKATGEYEPTARAGEVAMASYYCTGTNQKNNAKLWLCRIRNKQYYDFFLRLNGEKGALADTQGTYNPLNFTSGLEYDNKRIKCEANVRAESFTMMFKDKNLSRYDSALGKWQRDGGAKGKKEIAEWAKTNWDGKVKVEDNPAWNQ